MQLVELDDREDVRLAVVMSGGISLSVWMGGVTREIDLLLQANKEIAQVPEGEQPNNTSASPYRQLLEFTESTVEVDVISGTSAGGLNGALLAASIAYGSRMDALSDLWLTQAGFKELLRKPTDKNPPSLLAGDEYFLQKIADAMKSLRPSGAIPTEEARRLQLFITATLLQGESRVYKDKYENPIPEVSHRGLFTFQHQDFADELATDRLALAARTSASFPGAFEASFVPVTREDASNDETPSGGRPNMKGSADWTASRFAVDGGVLVNRPLRPAIRAILRQPATREVRRVVLLVVPDPGLVTNPPADKEGEPPALRDVLGATTRLPSVQSTADELDEIEAHNLRLEKQRLARDTLWRRTAGGYCPDELGMFGVFRMLLVRRMAEERVRWISAERLDERIGRPKRDASTGGPPGVETHREVVRTPIEKALEEKMPSSFPSIYGFSRGSSEVEEEHLMLSPWPWGHSTIERAARFVLALMVRGMELTPPDPYVKEAGGPRERPAPTTFRHELRTLRSQVHQVLERIDQIREWEAEYWGEVPSEGTSWASKAVTGWESRLLELDRDQPPHWRKTQLPNPLTELATMTALAYIAAEPILVAITARIAALYWAHRSAASQGEPVSSSEPPPSKADMERADSLRELLEATSIGDIPAPGVDDAAAARPDSVEWLRAEEYLGSFLRTLPPPDFKVQGSLLASARYVSGVADRFAVVSTLAPIQKPTREAGRRLRVGVGLLQEVERWLGRMLCVEVALAPLMAATKQRSKRSTLCC